MAAMWRTLLLLLLLLLGSTASSVKDYTIQFEGLELRVTEHLPPRLAVRDAVSLICRVESHRAARMRIVGAGRGLLHPVWWGVSDMARRPRCSAAIPHARAARHNGHGRPPQAVIGAARK